MRDGKQIWNFLKSSSVRKKSDIKSEFYCVLDSSYKDWIQLKTDGSKDAQTDATDLHL